MAPPTVPLDVVRSANAALVIKHSLVAVFAGGTSGIGEYRDCAFILLLPIREGGRPVFDQGCDRCCDEIIKLEQKESDGPARVDLLVMSHADLHFGGDQTMEGLDKSMSLLYYSRIRFITKLMPLLAASQLPAHVISIYAGGKEAGGKLFTEDLSLRDPSHYSFVNVRTHLVHMKTMSFETFAQQNLAQISLVHVFPGLVITPAFNSSSLPLWFRLIWLLWAPIAKMYSVKPQEIGERILGFASDRFPARAARQTEEQKKGPGDVAKSTDGVVGGGAYSAKYDGQVNSVDDAYQKLRPDAFGKRAWDYTMKAFEEIEAGHIFKE